MSFLNSLGSPSGEMHARICCFSSGMYGLIEIDFWFGPFCRFKSECCSLLISDIHNSMKIKLWHYSEKNKKGEKVFSHVAELKQKLI